MIRARLLLILSLAIFVTSMPNDFENDDLEDRKDKGNPLGLVPNGNTVCGWAGRAPFCTKNWTPMKCKNWMKNYFWWTHEVKYSKYWFVAKTDKKGDGKKCATGTKAACCMNAE